MVFKSSGKAQAPPPVIGQRSLSSDDSGSMTVMSSSSSISDSSSGVTDLSSASSSSSSRLRGGHPSGGCGSSVCSSTSDYQRSTPSPRDNNEDTFSTSSSSGHGSGDEIKDEPALEVGGGGISAESFYSKPKRPKSNIATGTTADLDPKITLLQEVKVKLERLPLKEAMDGFSRIKVSPPRKRRGSGERRDGSGKGDGNGGWFAKRAKTDKVGSNLDVYFGNPKLIRPPILNVKATDDSKANKSAAALQPFLPQQPSKRSSYLFGGGDDDDEFERVPDDEVIVTDDTDDEEEDETEDDDDIEVIEVKKKSPKDGFEASAAISPAVIKLEDAISVAAGPVIKAAPTAVQKPVVPIVPDAVPATIPLLMRMKKEASAASAVPAKIRFPAPSSGNRNMIECKWTDCQMSFTTYGKLSDHLRASHVIGQVMEQAAKLESDGPDEHDEVYRCLWAGCKVHGKTSCSKSWLEKHVPTHGGKFNFACMIGGCKQRFSSQKMLQRHVNNHFSDDEKDGAGGSGSGKRGKSGNKKGGKEGGKLALGVRKTVDMANKSESQKNLKRAGVKLKLRPVVFSARIFDFFDPSVMPGLRHANYDLAGSRYSAQEVEFTPRVTGLRTNAKTGAREANVRWLPENLLEDEWLPLSAVPRTRSLKICHLPEAAKVKLHADLFAKEKETSNNSPSVPAVAQARGPPRGASRRKQKGPLPSWSPMKRTEDAPAII